jgi:hypothetical protein
MPPTHRRIDDPDEFNGHAFRADDPELRLGYKQASLSVRGIGVFIALAVLAIVASNFYAGILIKDTIKDENRVIAKALTDSHTVASKDHITLRIAQDRTSCIITMTQEDRIDFRKRYQPGAFKQMCPWMDE